MPLDVDLGSSVSLVFGTPILARKIADAEQLNPGLRDAILKAEANDKGMQHTNIGGWQSAPTLLEWPVPEIATLRGWLEKAALQMASLPFKEPMTLKYRAYAWANVNRHGNYNTVHNHGEDHWAMVYYVDCGKPEEGRTMNGSFEMRDPRVTATTAAMDKYPGFTFGKALAIKPKPGMLLAFPAWLDHQVHPFFGEGERISIAANFKVHKIEKETPK